MSIEARSDGWYIIWPDREVGPFPTLRDAEDWLDALDHFQHFTD